jgi:hypothetical protein
MSIGPDICDAPTLAPAPPAGHDDAPAWSERRLAILSELAEAGLEIALALKTRIVETATLEPDPGTCADLTLAFHRASRAVRMSIALRDRLAKDEPLGEQTQPSAAREARNETAERVRRIVRRVARTKEIDSFKVDAFDRQARERLFDADITGELEGRSIGELVAKICADLGLPPPWRTLAEEAWAQAEILQRPEGSPYAAWPDLPHDPDPDPD